MRFHVHVWLLLLLIPAVLPVLCCAARGALTEIQNVSTLPSGQAVETRFAAAEIAVHPSGKFLYGSTRGHNTIAVFNIDSKTGRLAATGRSLDIGSPVCVMCVPVR